MAKPSGARWRPTFNFLLDVTTLVLMLTLLFTGLVMRYLLPRGSGGFYGGGGLALWGLNRHDWGGIHFWISLLLVVLLLVHVALHWSWVHGMVRRWSRNSPLGERVPGARAFTAYGIGFLALLTLLVLCITLLAWSSVERVPPRADRADRGIEQGGGQREAMEMGPRRGRHRR